MEHRDRPLFHISFYFPQSLTYTLVKDQICFAFQLCLSFINDNKILPMKLMCQPRSRANLKRSTSNNEAIRILNKVNRISIGFIGKDFSIKCDLGAHCLSACRTQRNRVLIFKDKIRAVFLPAAHAVTTKSASVYLLNVPAPGFLMEPVNILCDDPVQFSLLFHLCKLQMRCIRLSISAIKITAEVVKENFWLLVQAVAAQ